MTRVWCSFFLYLTALVVPVVPARVLAQQITSKSQVVTRGDSGGGLMSGSQRVGVVQKRAGAVTADAMANGLQSQSHIASTGSKPQPSFVSGVTVSSASFGSVAVGSSNSMSLTFNAGSGSTFTTGNGPDFSITSTACSTSCSAQVVFQPSYPGLRTSVVTATNASGVVVAKTFVYGTGTAPQLGFELGYATTFPSSFDSRIQQPTGVTLGPDRTAYFTDAGSKQVYTINRYNTADPYGLTTLPIQNLTSPAGVAVDGAGTVYVADKTNNVIVSYLPATQTQGTVQTSQLSGPTGLAVDGTGALYIADTGNGRIIRIDNHGAETTLARGLTTPQGVAVDSAGDVFYNNNDSTSGGTIVELPAGGGPAQQFGSDLGAVQALALDPGGTLYYSTSTAFGLLTTTGGLATYGGTPPAGIAVGPNGDLYTALGSVGEFDTTDRSSGNFIVSAAVGGTAQGVLTVRNTGNAQLNLSNIATSEPAVYTLDTVSVCASGYVLAPSATCDATVDYNPVTPGADQQTVNVTSNTLNGNQVVKQFILYGYAGQTSTTLTASTNDAVAGQPVTFAATVYPQNGQAFPTGMIQFKDGSTVIATVSLAQSGSSSQSVATYTTSALGLGTHSIVAIYLGSSTQDTSTSPSQTVLVTGGTGTTTSLTVSAASVSAGATETLTATIAGGSAPAVSGMVTFSDQNGTLGTGTVAATSTGGTATLTLTTLSAGNHAVYAMYSGDNTYSASTSAVRNVTVTSGTPVTVQSQNFGTTPVGTPVSMTLTFSGATSGLIQTTVSQDFTITSAGCYSTCTATVSFNPQYPGLRTDAVTFSDGNGTVYERIYLYGVGTGPQFGFDPGLSQVYQEFADIPTGVAIGPDDTKFFTDQGTNQLRILSSVGPSTPTITGLGTPAGVAVDGNDTVYIADQTNNVIVTYGYKSGVQGSVATSVPLSGPTGLAVDGTGALYIADTGNNRILKVDNQGTTTTAAGGLSSPTWIALDAAGDLYYTDSNNAGEIVELPVGGGGPVSIGSSIGTVRGLAVDAANRVYYTSYSGVEIISTSRGFTPYSIQGLTGALDGIAVGRAGDVVVAQGSSGQVDVSSRGTMTYYLTANVGATSTDTFSISNTGNAALTLSSETISGTVFTIDPSSQCGAGTVLAAGQTCSLQVNFRPTAAQTYQETLTGVSNSLNVSGSTNNYFLNGTGTASGTVATTTTLSVSPATVFSGTAETLTATVSGGTSPAISGSVTFYDQSGALGSGTIVATSTGGTATLSVTFLSVGGHQIYGLYNGDGNYGQSTSATQTVTVVQGSTTTSLAVSPASLTTGQPETLTATVTSAGTPALTQNVTFYLMTTSTPTTLGSTAVTATSTGGIASLTVTTLPVGNDAVYASYSGDNNYTGSTSGMQTVTVTSGAASTTTSLSVDRSSVVYRTPVAFTASVATSSGTAVTAGQVIFCDVAAPFCTRDQNLAIAQVNASGVATTRMAAGVVGNHAFRALFVGTTGFSTSASASQNVAVTAPPSYADYATLQVSGNPGSYQLTASVTGLSTRLLAPTGQVTFNDTTNTANPVLGTANLGAARLGFLALPSAESPVAVGTHPYGVATGDFDGDGYPDLVTENYNGNSISVLRGSGNGSFRPAVSYAVGSLPERVLVADFNGDGNQDLVVANTGSGTVSVLLGNGDGTFQTQVTYGCASPVGLGVMDLNHDGFPDIVAGDYYANTISVLLGNGDGTFRNAVTYPTGNTPQTLAEGDFNGDGNVDVAVGNEGSGTVGILLGNGDGTFRPQVTYAVGSLPQGVQVGDFNGDGLDDLAVSNQGDGTISVLLGNGDGTFRPQVTYAVGGQPVGLVVADFNGDGFQDLSVGNTAQSSLTQSILMGNGDGTFQPQMTFHTGNFPYGEAVADFDGNGFPDLAISNFSDSTATILLSFPTQTTTASLTEINVTGAAGTHLLNAAYAGDANFGAYTSQTVPVIVQGPAAVATTTSLTIAPPSAAVGQAVGFTVSVAGTTQTTPAATGTVMLMNTSVSPASVLGVVTLGVSGSGSFSGSSLAPGTYTITAVYGGDSNYAASTSAPQMLVVSRAASAAIIMVSPGNIPVGQGETLSVSLQGSAAVALSGTVTFLDGSAVLGTSAVSPGSSVNGVATATAMLSVSSLAVGPHTITARYSGDSNYNGSTSAAQAVTVSQASAAVVLGVSAGTLAAGQTETLTATVQHAGPPAVSGTVTFFDGTTMLGAVPVMATMVGGTAILPVTTLAVGPHQIVARYSGDTNFTVAASTAQTVTVTLAAQTITFPTIAGHVIGDAPFTLNATASSGLPVTYAVVSGPATVAGNLVTVTGVGTVVIQASQSGNTTYAAATAVTQSFAVTAAPVVTLSAISPASVVVGTAAPTVTLTGTNFLARDAVQLNGVAIASTFVNATTIMAVIPASFVGTAQTGQVTVVDPQITARTAVVAFAVVGVPAVTFTGPTTASSAAQPALTLAVNAYPMAITGTLTLTFTPASSGIDDPAVQFASGGRTLTFTIPANSTTTPAVMLQTGTVAGTATATLTLNSNGLNVTPTTTTPVVITIASAAPSVTTATATRATNTLTVVTHGFSNTRQITTATFHFIPVQGSTINNPDVTVDVTAEFAQWFGSAASTQYGSSFTYTQQFTLDQDVSSIASVSVTLTNSVGASAASTTQ